MTISKWRTTLAQPGLHRVPARVYLAERLAQLAPRHGREHVATSVHPVNHVDPVQLTGRVGDLAQHPRGRHASPCFVGCSGSFELGTALELDAPPGNELRPYTLCSRTLIYMVISPHRSACICSSVPRCAPKDRNCLALKTVRCYRHTHCITPRLPY